MVRPTRVSLALCLALAILSLAPFALGTPALQPASAALRAQLAESLPLIGADRVHRELGLSGRGVGVLVVDDWAVGEDGRRHGQAVAEIVRATAPGATVWSCKLDLTRAAAAQIAQCLRDALEVRPAVRVVNLSLAVGDQAYSRPCGERESPLAHEIRRLSRAGVLFVAAAGNDGLSGALRYPACLPEVISVGASYDLHGTMRFDSNGTSCRDRAAPDRIACYSNVAPFLDLVAPGSVVDTPSAPGFGGTSAAAPLVSGTVALMLEAEPALGRAELLTALRRTAAPAFDALGRRYPRIDAYQAVRGLIGGITRFDANGNGFLDDPEVYAAIDAWVGGRISDALFFRVIDSWIRRRPLVTGEALGPGSEGAPSTAKLLERARTVRLYDLGGRPVAWFSGSETRGALRRLGRTLAVGVYLYVARLPEGTVAGKLALTGSSR